jgi:ABC transporter substrate binding protein (PQQ-dependent alcohol dehydrogenase system)
VRAMANRPIPRRGFLAGAAALWARAAVAEVPAITDGHLVRIGYLRSTERYPAISPIDRPSLDNGLAGAQMAISDNNTTGRFLGQRYELAELPVGGQAEPAALRALVATDIRLSLTDLDADRLLALADSGRADGVTLFNIAAPDDRLRQQECRANVIHVAPTRRMLTDALAQYLVTRRWSRWLLVYGSHPGDAMLADAYRGSAKRFGARIVEERLFNDTGGARQSDSGIVQVQQQIPVFTQHAPDYDVLVAADENEVFAAHLPYRTWDPRPVAGSAGLRPVSWDAASESWGGMQMQNRFRAKFLDRAMPDYG